MNPATWSTGSYPLARPSSRPALEGPQAPLAAQEKAGTSYAGTSYAGARSARDATSAPGPLPTEPGPALAEPAPPPTEPAPTESGPALAKPVPAPTEPAPASMSAPGHAARALRAPASRTTAPARAAVLEASGTPHLAVVVPAYQPDTRLVGLVDDLHEALPGCRVLVVDDGSGPDYVAVFAQARAQGAVVVTHQVNSGKGQALRTGLARAATTWPGADVVCADADGQHTPADIRAVATRVRTTGHMTLGVRRFTGRVPLRSRVGNTATALLFAGATGWRLRDTQTGLRGFPAGELAWLQTVPGNRYEYELSQLLEAHERGLAVEEVEIATVYEPGNTSSHFRPVQDSARIYAPLLRFIGASLASFVIDWVGVVVLMALSGNLLTSVVVARIISGTANFFLNRRVFRAQAGTVGRTAVRYLGLALVLLAASYLMLRVLTGLGLGVGTAKVVGDGTVYVISYLAQRHLVFRRGHSG